ncbi:MFS transporter [Aliiroseovarius sp. PTFE2010]|uniref:MFS transporter n=1 Tax=Aliiroseovarius sp. PTFE2010 TaxID=3417190 RepID=UPI003CEF0106
MRLPIVFILATVGIDAIGIGLILPIMPALLIEVSGNTLADSAIWGGVLATAFAVMQFLFGPVVGNLSDAYGRRPVLMFALAVMALDYVFMAVADTVWLLLAGRVIAGLAAATHTTANAFMADISEKDDRSRRFGMVGAAFGVGFVAGPILGGLLAGIDTRAPFWAAAGLALANLVFGYFVMPETVTKATRRPFSWARGNPLSAVRAVGKLPGSKRLLTVLGLYTLALFSYPAIWAFYGKAAFGWSEGMIGLSLSLFGVSMAISQGALVAPAIRVLGQRGTVVAAMLADLVAFSILITTGSGTMALIATPIASLSSVLMPALQGILANQTPDDQQGELQGVIASVMALATIIAPLIMTTVFAYFTRPAAATPFPGAPFAVAAGLVILALAVFLTSPRAAPSPSGA